ncbi:uncharacterized protein BO95DRAFT_118762 [Aspergillus brunneoviolaceus CBS 621.78]|uniref:Uncharacterized protein n=1 Tax=Aspergillus brunneoviolaceus CBS 621.78 TaxID=1450534 RepID=A0ACD1GNQ4_9EURO|nr:hypothetical protein BO95DRAFT_118762 [Aspergillus brunneoviolaceus CBS 621.78]RAH50999.1 hypothetical protein BO95DRAFT_118762 [Aspergillus brunneoviolaceus CBS 621.78]
MHTHTHTSIFMHCAIAYQSHSHKTLAVHQLTITKTIARDYFTAAPGEGGRGILPLRRTITFRCWCCPRMEKHYPEPTAASQTRKNHVGFCSEDRPHLVLSPPPYIFGDLGEGRGSGADAAGAGGVGVGGLCWWGLCYNTPLDLIVLGQLGQWVKV